jgi:hypothetical protein
VTTYYQLAVGWPEVLLSCMLNGSRNFEIPNYPCKFRLACYVNVRMFLSLKYIGVPRFAMSGFLHTSNPPTDLNAFIVYKMVSNLLRCVEIYNFKFSLLHGCW